MRVAIGRDFAATMLDKQALFVDKTLFVRDFLDSGQLSLLVTRPRRFGKSFNLSMLRAFLSHDQAEANRVLFEGTKVARACLSDGHLCMDFQGKYPVISAIIILAKWGILFRERGLWIYTCK